ncbi:MAG TPA: hypothetical protein VJH67_01210 [Candidatus Paceibacterota bacterium]
MNENVVDINEFRKRKNVELLNEAGNIQKKFEKRNRAHTTTFVLMLSVAIFFDTLQAIFLLIPFLGWIFSSLISIFAWLTFYVWTSIKGWGLSDTLKQIIVNWALPFIEIIPILNTLPTWTLKVVLSYSFLKAEDTLYNVSGGKADAEKLENLLRKVA